MTTKALTTGGEKSRPKPIGARLKVSLDAMAFEGLPMDEAAQRGGLTCSAVRKALLRPHILNYLREQRQVVQTAEMPRTFRRMVTLLHQDDNKAAAVAAGRTLMTNAQDETPTFGAGSQQRVAGIVVQIVTAPAPLDTPCRPMISVTTVDSSGERNSPVIGTAPKGPA